MKRRDRRLLLRALFLGIGVAAISATAVWQSVTTSSIRVAPVALIASLGFFLLTVSTFLSVKGTLLHSHRFSELRNHQSELAALINLKPMVAAVPIRLDDWAANPAFLEQVVLLLQEQKPSLVVECGSGTSTILIAACLRRMGHGALISLEHDEGYAWRTTDMLNENGLAPYASVLVSPLEIRKIDGEAIPWYSRIPEFTQAIDFLLVDGPPGPIARRIRYPAVPVLKECLSDACTVVLHDGDRPDERWAAERWALQLNGDLERLDTPRGGWIVRRQAKKPQIESEAVKAASG